MNLCVCPVGCFLHFSHWPKHEDDTSDTADTGEDEQVGGLGYSSHGNICLSHQHWVEQLILSGSFSVHCTEAAEAKHKTCMHLPSHRVKHSRQNITQRSMLRYLQRRDLFLHLQSTQTAPVTDDPNKNSVVLAEKVMLPLRIVTAHGRRVVNMGNNLCSVAQQELFLHPEVRVARVELMDLLCDRLGMPRSRLSYAKMNRLEWVFGQKMVTSRKTTLWATDSQYMCPTSENMSQRRDTYLLRGTERILVQHPSGTLRKKPTALCCEAICFITVKNIRDLNHALPLSVTAELCKGIHLRISHACACVSCRLHAYVLLHVCVCPFLCLRLSIFMHAYVLFAACVCPFLCLRLSICMHAYVLFI